VRKCSGLCVSQEQTVCNKRNVTMACVKEHKTCDKLWKFWDGRKKAGKIDADVKVCCNVKVAAATKDAELTKPAHLAEECRVYKKA